MGAELPRRRSLGPLFRTLRYLRLSQVVARASFLLERGVVRPRPRLLPRRYARLSVAASAELRDVRVWGWPPAPFDPSARAAAERAAVLLNGRYTALNLSRSLGEPIDWAQLGAPRLWRFHLHGCAWWIDLAVQARRGDPRMYASLRRYADSWITSHVPGADDAWHPFVAATRLIAILVSRDVLGPTLEDDPAFARQLREAAILHALFLERHLEYDVGGNHLLKNAVALLLAGAAFDGRIARRWRTIASRVLHHEIRRQVLPDGGHFERSPMYHLLVLEDLLVALRAAGRWNLPLGGPLARAVERMQRVAVTLQHPDGNIPLFNDSVLGEAPMPAALVGPATQGVGGPALPQSGYFKLILPPGHATPGALLIADCGPPGPDDLPAHVHADALSFELSVGERRVIVNGGTESYEAGPRRTWFRGTAAHNTLTVDEQDQSEVWANFRVGRRARVTCDGWKDGGADDVSTLIGSHDGYARLGVRHERRFDAVPGCGWRILDTLFGHTRHRVCSRLRLAAGLRWETAGPDREEFVARDEGGAPLLRVRPFGGVHALIAQEAYAPRFYSSTLVDVLQMRRTGVCPMIVGYWLLLGDAEPALV